MFEKRKTKKKLVKGKITTAKRYMFPNQRFATLWYQFIRSAVTLAAFLLLIYRLFPFAWLRFAYHFSGQWFSSLFFYIYFVIRPIHWHWKWKRDREWEHTHTEYRIYLDCAHITKKNLYMNLVQLNLVYQSHESGRWFC